MSEYICVPHGESACPECHKYIIGVESELSLLREERDRLKEELAEKRLVWAINERLRSKVERYVEGLKELTENHLPSIIDSYEKKCLDGWELQVALRIAKAALRNGERSETVRSEATEGEKA